MYQYCSEAKRKYQISIPQYSQSMHLVFRFCCSSKFIMKHSDALHKKKLDMISELTNLKDLSKYYFLFINLVL